MAHRLGHIGAAQAFKTKVFKNGLGAEIMKYILRTWQAMLLRRDVRHETCITALLVDQLNKDFDADGREWMAVPEVPVSDPDYGTQLGRNDIRFYPAPHRHRSIFFTAECKRLRVRTDSGLSHLADEYVTEGMQRFVDGHYAQGIPVGGMVGYVMDNNLDRALEQVREHIESRRGPLRITTRAADKTPCRGLHPWRHSSDTRHRRSEGIIALHHLLLGVNQIAS